VARKIKVIYTNFSTPQLSALMIKMELSFWFYREGIFHIEIPSPVLKKLNENQSELPATCLFF
jgi:hypothetical protein